MTQCHPPGDARSAGIEAPAKGRTHRVSKREGMQRMLRRSAGSNAFLGCLAWASWFEGPRSPCKAGRCRSHCWLGTCAPAEQDRDRAPQMSECKVSNAAPLDALDVGDRPGTSLTSPRGLHQAPRGRRRPLATVRPHHGCSHRAGGRDSVTSPLPGRPLCRSACKFPAGPGPGLTVWTPRQASPAGDAMPPTGPPKYRFTPFKHTHNFGLGLSYIVVLPPLRAPRACPQSKSPPR